MAARPTWKGLLKVRLVTIPIKVFPATESNDGLAFTQLHATCQTRLQQRRWCPHCVRSIEAGEVAKGFEFSPARFVILSDADVARVRPESARVIDLVQFVTEALLHPMFVHRSYYVAPDGRKSIEAFVLMREAMLGQVGIGKLAIYGREYLVAVRPHLGMLLLHTLHHAAEIRPIAAVYDDALGAMPRPAPLTLARRLIATLRRPLNLTDFQDDYRARLQTVITAKIDGREIVTAADAPPRVIDLMEALTHSLLGPTKRATKHRHKRGPQFRTAK